MVFENSSARAVMATRCSSARSSLSTVSLLPSSIFQTTSGLSRSRFERKSKARSTWKHSCASRKSGCASSTIAPMSAKRSAALRVIRDFGVDRRDFEIGE
jgi:hypothetical protein